MKRDRRKLPADIEARLARQMAERDQLAGVVAALRSAACICGPDPIAPMVLAEAHALLADEYRRKARGM